MKDIKQLLPNLPEEPTLKYLREQRKNENLVGSKLKKAKKSGKKEFLFYEDESVLVYDQEKDTYHFITKEGRKKLSASERRKINETIDKENISQYVKLESGNFSQCYDFSPISSLAVKVTDGGNFTGKELSHVFSEAYDKLMSSSGELQRLMVGGRKIVQDIDLKSVLEILALVKEEGFKTPDFYGFTVKGKAEPEKLQEYQFMERVDRPTLDKIFEDIKEDEQIDFSKIPHSQILVNARRYFESDEEMLGALANLFYEFRGDIKGKIYDIGDIEMGNLFVYDFNPETKEFTLMVIDPIREMELIRLFKPKEEKYQKNLYFMIN